MSELGSIKGEVSFDTTKADEALGRVEVRAGKMATAVVQAGATAAKGVEGLNTAVEKLDKQQISILESIKRRSVIATEGQAAFQAQRAAMAGISDAAAPYIAKLKQAEQAQTNLGMSAKATSAALRQVPAQFTDIITSLQAGQAPLTVLLQQGGQLKDTFGGVGPAFRAMGGYLLGLVNPLTVTAVAVGGLTYAFMQGGKEAQNYAKAIILSGNAAGVTSSQLQDMAASLSTVQGTQSAAAAALAEFVEAGQVGRTNLEAFAGAALKFEKATGQAVGKTVDQFAELAKSPLDATVKLNEKYNFLTEAVYRQIKALEEQGRTTDAANVAQKAFADTLDSRAAQIIQNLGLIERGWNGVKGAIKGAGDALLGIGREQSLGEQIKIAERVLQDRQARNASLGIKGGLATQQDGAALAALRGTEAANQANAEAVAEQLRLNKSLFAFEKDGDQYLSKRAQMERDLNKERARGLELLKASKITQEELDQRLANIREKYKESGAAGVGESEVAGINAKVKEQLALNQRLQAQIAGGDLADNVQSTEAEKLVLKLRQELTTTITGQARAQKQLSLAAAEGLVVQQQEGRGLEQQLKGIREHAALLDKQDESVAREAERTRDAALGQEAVNAAFGKSKTAIEQTTLAQMRSKLAESDSDSFRATYVAGLQNAVVWQERYVKSLQQSEFRQKQLQLAETGRGLAADSEMLQLELSLLGQTQQAREQIVGQRRVELKLAEELADIEKRNLGDDKKEADLLRDELRSQARANAFVEANNVAQKAVLDEWQRTTDSINASLTDALLRGFEDGKDFAENFADTLKNMFSTLVLRPVIQAVLAPVSGAASQLTSGLTGGSGFGGLASSSLGQAFGLSNAAAVAGNNPSAFIPAGGALSGVGSALPYVGGALLVASLLKDAFKGETRSGGVYHGTQFQVGPSGGEIGSEAVRQAIGGTMESINATLKALGSNAQLAGLVSGLESSEKGKGFAFAGGTLTSGAAFGQGADGFGWQNRRGSMTTEQANAAFSEELKQATLQALQAANVPGLLGDYLRELGDIDALSGGALDAALGRLNKALTERASLEDRLFATTATDLQKLTKAREAERAAIDESNRALYDQVAAQEDLQRAVGGARTNLQTAYDAERQAIESTKSRLETLTKSIRSFRDGLLLGSLSPLTPGQKYAEAASSYATTRAQAQAGDVGALEKLPQISEAFLEASRTYNASGAEYQRDFAMVLADSENMQTLAELQLETSRDQLSRLDLMVAGLIDLKPAILTVAEAVRQLAGAGGGGTIDPVTQAYQDLLGRAPDAEGGAYFRGMLAVGRSEADIRASIMNSPEYKRLRGIPLATGMDRIPYDGYAATLHADEAVLNRDAAQAWRSSMGGEGNAALLARIDALCKEVELLRQENRQDAGAIVTGIVASAQQSAETIVAGTTDAASRATFTRNAAPALA